LDAKIADKSFAEIVREKVAGYSWVGRPKSEDGCTKMEDGRWKMEVWGRKMEVWGTS
jgi:hypothetical protein